MPSACGHPCGTQKIFRALKLFKLMMTATLIATTTVGGPISIAADNYKAVDSYRVTLRSRSDNSIEEIKYYYKRPGFVKMEFIEPHKSAVLVYNPLKKEVRLRPFGFLKFFVITLSPDSNLIKSSKGHRVDESDIGALLKTVGMLQSGGKTEILGNEDVGGKEALKVNVEGGKESAVDGVNRYVLWLDKNTFLPLKVAAYDLEGKPVEEVLMDDIETNLEFPKDFFDL